MSQPSRTLTTCLFPGQVFEVIKFKDFNDKQILGILQIALNVALGASQAWIKGNLKQIEGTFPKLTYSGFDPNPGDGGCQKRGFLHQLAARK